MGKDQRYKYIVVEDEPLIRKNIIKKVQSLTLPLTFVGEASNGISAEALIGKELPCIVITDIRMPGCSGLELAARIYNRYPKIKVLILSGYDDFAFAQTAIKYQVCDYLLKPVSTEALHTSLQHLLIALDSEDQELASKFSNSRPLSHEDLCELMTKYFRQNYQRDFSLSELGEKMGYTPEYLGKLFKKIMGETPSKYLTKLRLNEAKYLLTNQPELEVHKVGELVGYKDAFYFSRMFKLNVGVYPSDYRAANSAAKPEA